MPKQGRSTNTRSGGHQKETRFRHITADPNGNREQRRAARKLGITQEHAMTCPSSTPTCDIYQPRCTIPATHRYRHAHHTNGVWITRCAQHIDCLDKSIDFDIEPLDGTR